MEERSDVAISYIYNELEIASHSFAMTIWYYAKLSKDQLEYHKFSQTIRGTNRC